MIEEELRRALQSQDRTIPMWTDPVRRVRAGMRRRLRRAIAVTAAAVMVVGGTGAAVIGAGNLFGTKPSISPAESGLIPWVEQQVPMRLEPRPPLRLPASAPCPATDLKWTDEVRGTLITEPGDTEVEQVAIGVVNIGTRTCALSGHPLVRFVEPATEKLATGPAEEPAIIDPGEAAYVGIIFRNNCPGETVVYRHLEAWLEGGEHFLLDRLSHQSTCAPMVTSWRRESRYDKAPTRGLAARLVAPATAKSGAELTYVLELTNVTDGALRPCLRFWHGLVTSSRRGDDMWQLNCVKDSIQPGEKLRYEMKMLIPQEVAPGPSLVLFDGEWGPSVADQIQITS